MLHYNENIRRKHAETKEGKKKYTVSYPKSKCGGYIVRKVTENCTYGGSGPWSIMEYQGVSSFPNFFFLASLCSFICLQAVYQLSGAVCKATWNGYPSYSLLTFISRFVD